MIKASKTLFIISMVALNSFPGYLLAQTSSTAATNVSVITPVPLDFNGAVGTGARKSDGSIDLMNGLAASVTGGDFKRTYNGLSGQIETGEVLSDEALKTLNISLSSNLFGISELGPKFCRPVGKDYPGSILAWYWPVKDYVAAERVRDSLLKDRMDTVSKKMEALSKNKAQDQIQLDSIRLQVETLNAMIDSFSGSTMFSLDNKASEVRGTSRIAWREKLLTAASDAAVKNQEEDLKLVQLAQACAAASNVAINVARAGCDRKKPPRTECDSKGENCRTIIDPWPVPGSCQVAGYDIPFIHKGIFEDIVALYSLTQIPSAEINKRYVRLNDQLNTAINALPEGSDGYDWKSPMAACQNPVFGDVLKNTGMACVANHKAADLDKIGYKSIAPSSDILSNVMRAAIGRVPTTSEYNIAKAEYEKYKAAGESDAVAIPKLREWLVKTPMGKEYYSGEKLTAEEKAKYNQDLQSYAAANSLVEKSCVEANGCDSYKLNEPDFGLSTTTALSDNIVAFLGAIGIAGDDLEVAKVYFNESWALDDLQLGHSRQRVAYFEKVKAKIKDVLSDDRKRLGQALLQRETLLKYYREIEDMYKGKVAEKTTTVAAAALKAGTYNNTSTIKTATNLNVGQSSTAVKNLNTTLDMKTPISNASSARLDVVDLGASVNKLSGAAKAAFASNGNANAYSISANSKLQKSNQLLSKLSNAKKNVMESSSLFDKVPVEKDGQSIMIINGKTPAVSSALASKLSDTGIAQGVSSMPADTLASDKKSGSMDLSAGGYNSYMQGYGFASSSPKSLVASLRNDAGSSVMPKISGMGGGPGIKRGADKATNMSMAITGEDAAKVQDAIWHLENSNVKKNYSTEENDSIFEIVTKAHIRNYKNVISVP